MGIGEITSIRMGVSRHRMMTFFTCVHPNTTAAQFAPPPDSEGAQERTQHWIFAVACGGAFCACEGPGEAIQMSMGLVIVSTFTIVFPSLSFS